MPTISIADIQGEGLYSPYAKQTVCTTGVITCVTRRGFFLQTPDVTWNGQCSNAVFVYSPGLDVQAGLDIEINAKVVDYLKHESAKPITQLHFDSDAGHELFIKHSSGVDVEPIELTQSQLALDESALAELLNSLEGMLLKIAAGQTFIAPSNPFGDYVLALDAPDIDDSVLRSQQGGVITRDHDHLRWFPGFRVSNYNHAPRVNVGARLMNDIVGPLNYRADAYQLLVNHQVNVDPSFISVDKSSLRPSSGAVTIMTLNCFNLDPHVESESKVMNPRQDVDDDWGEGRFHTLAQAVVLQANTPDIVALQEIQDNDGAELSDEVDASETYVLLIRTIEQLSGVLYDWVDVPPELNADGGQPGGNIRNGYLYNPKRVSLVSGSASVFGSDQACFHGSRKPLLCEFTELSSQQTIAVINVHLASKRHQESIFAPQNPGVDAKLDVRIAQAQCVHDQLIPYQQAAHDYYVTGDFNDTEYSVTMSTLVGDNSVNLLMSLLPEQRYDYNHRGKLQVLMHGIVSQDQANGRAQYEIIHGNELIGVTPGQESNKPSDHAYVIAKLILQT